MRHVLLLVVALTGCPSDDPPPIDSPAAAIDSPAGMIDAPMGNVCTGLLYDRCSSNAQCMSGVCRMFNNLGVMLCTQVCVPGGTACPMQGATAVLCPANSMICRPNAANTCTPP